MVLLAGKVSGPNHKGRLLDQHSALLLHLEENSRCPDDEDKAKQAGTINELARVLRIGRTQVYRVLHPLIENDQVIKRRGRPRGNVRVDQYFELTAAGRESAIDIGLRLKDQPITFVEPKGCQTIRTSFKDLRKDIEAMGIRIIPNGTTLTTFISSDGRVDIEALLACREDDCVKLTENAPEITEFYGREQELREIETYLRKPKTRLLVLHGLPGVGKSYLASKFVQDRGKGWNVLWVNIQEYTTINTMLFELTELTTAINHMRALHIPPEGARTDLNLFLDHLRKRIGNRHCIVILDDFHKASKELRHLVSAFIDNAHRTPNLRLMIISRLLLKIYDRKDIISSKRVVEYELDGLDRESALKLLDVKGMSEKDAETAFDITKGIPLYLGLYNRLDEMHRHMSEELIDKLTQEQLDIMTIVSTFRIDVPMEALYRLETTRLEHIEALKERSMIKIKGDGLLYIHDILKDFFYRRMSPQEHIESHKHCAQFMSNYDEPQALVECIFHLLGAGDNHRAAEVAIRHGPDIVLTGYSEGLNRLFHRFNRNEIDERTWIRLMLLFGRTHQSTGDLTEAVVAFKAALDIAQEHGFNDLQCISNCRLGYIFHEIGNNADVERHLLDALENSDDVNEPLVHVEILRGLGRLNWSRSEHESGKKRYREALTILDEHDDHLMRGMILSDLASIHWDHDDFDSTIRYATEALELLNRVEDLNEIARAEGILGVAFESIGDHSKSIEHLKRRIRIAEQTHNFLELIYGRVNLAHSYVNNGQIENAIKMIQSVKDKIITGNLQNILQKVYRVEGLIEENHGNTEGADLLFKAAIDITLERFPRFIHKLAEEYSQILINRGDLAGATKVLEEALSVSIDCSPEIQDKLRNLLSKVNI